MMLAHILHGAAIGLFLSAGATAIGAIAATVVPRWHRIGQALRGKAAREATILIDERRHAGMGAAR